MRRHIVIKAAIIAVPTYGTAYLTELMVYTIPTLAITTFIAAHLFNEDNIIRPDNDGDTDGTDLDDLGQ